MPATERTACAECDLLLQIEEIAEGQRAACPRCGHVLTAPAADGLTRSLAFAKRPSASPSDSAEGSWQVGRHDEALGALAVGIVRAQEKGQHYWDADLHRLRGEILLDEDAGSAEEAEGLFHQALETARRQEAKGLEPRAATSLARLWQRHGKPAEARDLLQPVYDWFTEGFDTQDLKDAKVLLGELA